jgi:hypothetical protein
MAVLNDDISLGLTNDSGTSSSATCSAVNILSSTIKSGMDLPVCNAVFAIRAEAA